MNVVFLSHTAPGGTFVVGSHHYSREVAMQGHHVAHVSTPVSVAHLVKIRDGDVRHRLRMAWTSTRACRAPGLVDVVPRTALPLGHVVSKVETHAAARKLAAKLRKCGMSHVDVLFIDQPLMGSFIDAIAPDVLIYRPTDSHFGGSAEEAERRLLSRANGIVATSEPVLERLRRISPAARSLPAIVLENGVDPAFFDPQRRDGRQGAVYIGAIDRRFDWAAVQRIAVENPLIRVQLAGPVTSAPPKDLASNVKLLGRIAYDKVPDLLRTAEVGLLPFSDDPGNAGRSPMKYFEYLACELTIVCRWSESLRDRGAPGTFLYDHSEGAPAAFERATSCGVNADGRSYAEQFTWPKRTAAILQFAESIRRGT